MRSRYDEIISEEGGFGYIHILFYFLASSCCLTTYQE